MLVFARVSCVLEVCVSLLAFVFSGSRVAVDLFNFSEQSMSEQSRHQSLWLAFVLPSRHAAVCYLPEPALWQCLLC